MTTWFNRATLGIALAVYAWTMMLVELYLRAARVPEGPDRGLALFRRLVMGRAVVAVGAAAVLAALVLAVLGRQRRVPAAVALVLAVGWLILLAAIWPV
jgi:hypothetical protein